ncbi:SCO family protein [Sphingomonas canadensis]|nr:SCO family protein [Sphingomonas canadensis]
MNSIHRRIATALAAVLLVAGCSPAPRPPLDGARIGGPFALTGTDGKTVRDTDFAGKYRLVYFGYTYCPDVCPTDMQRTARVMKALEKADPATADKIVPIFVTVDPDRDTPAAVKQFVSAFGNRFVGLTGNPEAIAQAAKAYAISYTKQPPGPGGGYLVDHVAVVYLMGPKGEPISFYSRDMTDEAMLADLRQWVK